MTQEVFDERKKTLEALISDKAYVPMKLKELAALLDVPKNRRDELKAVLDALVEEGKIGISAKGKYGRPELLGRIGVFRGHRKGFGFVCAEGMDTDVFIPAEHTAGAMDGDRVQILVETEQTGRRPEGRVIRILEHANRTVVGSYQKRKHFGFVVPDNPRLCQDIFIPEGKDMGAVTGHKVMVRIFDFGNSSRNPEGAVTEILGHISDPGTDILSVIRACGLPEEFPEEVTRQAGQVPERISPQELAGRLDLRHLPTVTIDGADAKDLDDAVTISKEGPDHYTLGVHIADVSHYVKEGGPLDAEARKRGTSVYLADRVIPMLPRRLSNGICSLNEGEDRLTLSCIMEIDGKGCVIGHRIAETVIRSDRRMTYQAVNDVLTGQEPVPEGYKEFRDMLLLMQELSGLLRERRKARGAIDFDFPECKIVLDEKGRTLDIRPYERNAATRLIEDFMLAANETIAEDSFWQELPFLYRTHDYPDPEKMKRLGIFIHNFGYSVRTQNGEVHPKELQKLLDRIEGTPEEALIGRLTLRSLKRAMYSTACAGHYGLAAKYYTHFTSPIRRYPDLQIHRILKENLRGGLGEKRRAHYEQILPETALLCTAAERRADEAERETEKMKKCEYMSRHIGEEYEGVISGVTGWGLYVELPNTAEGLIRIGDLRGDYFVFDESRMELAGEMTGRRYRLGQKLRIYVSGTDKMSRTIDFLPAEDETEEEDEKQGREGGWPKKASS